MTQSIAVLISGNGTNLQALLDAQADGGLGPGRVKLVAADRKSAYGLARAEAAGVETAVIPRKKQEYLLPPLKNSSIDWVVLSGYLSILPEKLINEYRNRIINIHPALSPAFSGMGFYGLKAHEAVLASGVKITGATVHFVDEGVDTGAIIAQRAVPVLQGDTAETLRGRVLETEHKLLVETVKALVEGRVCLEDGKAWVT